MTERQKFSLLEKHGNLQIRRYHPHVAADIVVEGDHVSAGNRGFRPLANYIFSNKIAMTAPVIVEGRSSGQSQVTFVMPDQSRLEEMPAPTGGVTLRKSDGEVCAAIEFRGYTSASKVARKTQELYRLLEENNLKAVGPVRVARFDPPWKPGIARHNELVIPIEWNN